MTQWLSIWHCHCYDSGHHGGMGFIPGPGTSTCTWQGKKKKKEKKEKHNKNSAWSLRLIRHRMCKYIYKALSTFPDPESVFSKLWYCGPFFVNPQSSQVEEYYISLSISWKFGDHAGNLYCNKSRWTSGITSKLKIGKRKCNKNSQIWKGDSPSLVFLLNQEN